MREQLKNKLSFTKRILSMIGLLQVGRLGQGQ
jgi:hypothetical protein